MFFKKKSRRNWASPQTNKNWIERTTLCWSCNLENCENGERSTHLKKVFTEEQQPFCTGSYIIVNFGPLIAQQINIFIQNIFHLERQQGKWLHQVTPRENRGRFVRSSAVTSVPLSKDKNGGWEDKTACLKFATLQNVGLGDSSKFTSEISAFCAQKI